MFYDTEVNGLEIQVPRAIYTYCLHFCCFFSNCKGKILVKKCSNRTVKEKTKASTIAFSQS